MGYLYKRTITIDDTKVSGAADLESFPVLISGTYDYLATVANGGKVTDDNGYDIIFTSDSEGNTQLDHEIESYTNTTGAVNFWVRIPALDGDAPTVIYMFYANSEVTTSQENIGGVWDASYQGVWHMNDLTTSTIKDSASTNNGTKKGANEPAVSASGKVGSCQDFAGTDDKITIPYNASLCPANALTIEGWINWDNLASAAQVPVSNRGDTDNGFFLRSLSTTSKLQFYVCNNPNWAGITSDDALNNTTWYYVFAMYDKSNLYLYLNGVSAATPVAETDAITYTADTALVLGCALPYDDTYYFAGLMDELRISSIARSTDWGITCFNNQSSPATFYAVGDETPVVTGTTNHLEFYRRTRFPGSITGL